MATSQLPAVIDALVTLTTAAATDELVVTDGFNTTEDPGDYLSVGVDAPDVISNAFSGSATQEPATLGTNRSRDERGSVTCVSEAWNGDGDAKAARDAAYSYVALVENVLRADPSLGIAAGGLMVAQMGGTSSLLQNQTNDGAVALVVFTVAYRARI